MKEQTSVPDIDPELGLVLGRSNRRLLAGPHVLGEHYLACNRVMYPM